MGAATNGHTDVIKLLLEQNGIDIFAECNSGLTFAQIVALNQTKLADVYEILKQKGIISDGESMPKVRPISSLSNKKAFADFNYGTVSSWSTYSSSIGGLKSAWGPNRTIVPEVRKPPQSNETSSATEDVDRSNTEEEEGDHKKEETE